MEVRGILVGVGGVGRSCDGEVGRVRNIRGLAKVFGYGCFILSVREISVVLSGGWWRTEVSDGSVMVFR